MGTVTFLLPDPLPDAAARCLESASLAAGYDQSPVPTRRAVNGRELTLSKDANESGYLSVPWPVPGFGTLICLSATLRERPEPYHLLLELARGKLNQARNLTAEWESIGMAVDPVDRTELDEATRLFGRAAVDPDDPAADAAGGDVLARSLRLGDRVARTFSEQLLLTRLVESGRLTTGLGCRLSRVPVPEEQARIAAACTAVRLVPDWRGIEPTEAGYDWAGFDALVDWAASAGLRASVGPVIDLGGPFPDWLRQWDGDLPSLAAFTCDFVETTVRRYQERVRTWQVFAGFNHADALGLGEDDRIRLAARLLESARQADPDAEWVVGLAQPWGDYLASEDYTYSPLVFADTLLRAGFSLSGIELELLFGGDRASRPRDPLEVYRILELFSVLGLPLEVAVGADGPADDCPPGWAETSLGLAVALPQVRSVFWAGGPGPPPAPTFGALEGLRRRFIA
jgi:hypothetical protein